MSLKISYHDQTLIEAYLLISTLYPLNSMAELMELMFQADVYQLNHVGKFITNDKYIRRGGLVVGLRAENLLLDGLPPRNCNLDYLSVSDQKILKKSGLKTINPQLQIASCPDGPLRLRELIYNLDVLAEYEELGFI